jgi:putative redox protein
MKARIKWMENVAFTGESESGHSLVMDGAPEDPKVFTRIHFHFVVTGQALKPEQVERAIHLSAEKYCSASIMLGKTAAITHDFEIREG